MGVGRSPARPPWAHQTQATPSDVQALIDGNYEFINGQKAKSTLQKTDRDLKRFKDFCEKAGAGREPEKLSAQILCAHIATYIRTLTRLDGSNYEPGSITSAHSSIERYLREKGYPYSIIGAPEFQMSREVVEAKRTLLKKSEKGNKPNAQTALTEDEIDQLWEEGGFGTGSPVEIVAAVWWLFVTHLGCGHPMNACSSKSVTSRSTETPWATGTSG